MIFKNPNSKRENSFRKIYDDKGFKSVLLNKSKPKKFPFLVDVELTNQCNLKCIFCGQQAMERHKGFMNKKIFKKIADECSKFSTPIRIIRWGEPFLHPDIIDFVKYAKKKNIMVHITNNGLAINEEHMKKVVTLKLDSMIFSFQGATKKQYELMRNNNLYDKLESNVIKMVSIRGDEEKPFIHISSTMTDETMPEIEQFVNYWVNKVDSVGIGKTNLSRLTVSQIKSFETIGKMNYLKTKETIKKIYMPCTEVYQKLSVDWDGKISCCCGDFDNYMTVGDLNVSTLFDTWNSSLRLKTFREMLNNGMHKSLTLCSTCYHTYDEF